MILQVSKYYYPDVGGIERAVQTLSEGLVDRGRDVEVIAASDDDSGRDWVNGVEVRRCKAYGTVQSVPVAPGFLTALREESKRADLIHYHLPNPLAVVADTLVRPDCPRVVTYHSDIVKQSWALEAYRPLLRQFLGRVDRIVTTSPPLLENSDELQPFREKCEVIPLGIDPEKYRGEPDTTLDCVDPDEPIVLFVGRLTYYKGVKYLIDAARNIDGTVVIVGEGPRRTALEQKAGNSESRSKVLFLGSIPESDLRTLYHLADVFVLPSVEPSEAFGIVQLEAMAAGTPVVNTDLETGVPWVSKDGETGITVATRDSRSLSKNVSALLKNDYIRERFEEEGISRVRSKFSSQEVENRYLKTYKDIL
jgi:rhamnosyl/mannosyltransferase